MSKPMPGDEPAIDGESATSRTTPPIRRGQRAQATSRSSKARRKRTAAVGGMHQRTNKRGAW